MRNTAGPAPGDWLDAVLVGRFAHGGGLAAGASYSNTIAFAAPGVPAGNCRVRVQADSRGLLRRCRRERAGPRRGSAARRTVHPGRARALLPTRRDRRRSARGRGRAHRWELRGPVRPRRGDPDDGQFDDGSAGAPGPATRLVVSANHSGPVHLRVRGAGAYTATATPLPFAPVGFGDANWAAAGAPQAYTIRFENDPKRATAAAQEVVISARLDPDLDPATFRLGSSGFGAHLARVPTGRQSFAQRVAAANPDGSPSRTTVEPPP